ncbi:plasmid pRiA4b ORF-3 family protein [Variovorax sp. J22R115]|nr:plasmid pRiA4b ORF-3 family protein [Variovorax sp. J22R115]MDM0053548.1 plasmid pRiA4b ORF-3 family protein [Variovorax sp. J22R115]
MEAGASSGQEVLQLRAVLRSISPLIWRRLLVRGDTSVARLHQILQVAFDWQDMHLHRFEIRGREYGVHQEGSIVFDTDAHEALIGELKLRRLERFIYQYDFGFVGARRAHRRHLAFGPEAGVSGVHRRPARRSSRGLRRSASVHGHSVRVHLDR